MKKRKTKAREQQTQRTESAFARQLVGYGAALAGGLLSCGQVDADIVHTGAMADLPAEVPVGGSFRLDIDLDGDFELRFWQSGAPGFGLIYDTQFAFFLASGSNAGIAYPAKLDYGDIISWNGSQGWDYVGWLGLASAVGHYASDPWGVFSNAPQTATGFIGVVFTGQTAGGGEGWTHGWVQLSIQAIPSAGQLDGFLPGHFTILDMAYENMGNPIGAGVTSGSGRVPEAGAASAIALSMLAMGASGLRRRREIKAAKA